MPVFGSRAQRIAAIAAAQRGMVARRQLLAAGISSSAISRLLATGALHRRHKGVYAVGYSGEVELGPETAALLACPEGAVLSHRTAAALWKLRPNPAPTAPVDVTLPRGKSARRSAIVVHRSAWLTHRDVRRHRGLPVTSPARTILDLAEVLDEREVERAINEGFVLGIMRASELRDVLKRSAGRRGGSLAAALLDRCATEQTTTRSECEELFLSLLREADLSVPQANAHVHGYTVDFLWRELGVVVEVDGFQYHFTRAAFERDREKSAKLMAAGLQVMRLTWRQMQEQPYAVIGRVAQALARASAWHPLPS